MKIAVTLVLALSFVLAGCGEKASGSGDAKPAGSGAPTASAKPAGSGTGGW